MKPVFVVLALIFFVQSERQHPRLKRSVAVRPEELESDFWNQKAQEILKRHLKVSLNLNVAKNVILFLGDGMSIPTLTAARIYKGQSNGEGGEDGSFEFESFPFTGLSKTYCVDTQVADSACSATAYLGGVKANEGTIGVGPAVGRTDCEASKTESNRVASVARWAQEAGKKTGLVTTTRVTHASPAGVYAHVADRGWEDDASVTGDGQNPTECPDIAHQLVFGSTGKNLNVVLGGGRRWFYPEGLKDLKGVEGRRKDGLNLIEEWKKDKAGKNASYSYVINRRELLHLEKPLDYLLGLFSPNHMDYHLEALAEDPTLAEMTEEAIKHLRSSPKGYFLFVEGGRIDHGHHDNMAKKALDETAELAKAISAAVNLTDESDTLIVVTSDHSHAMSMNGYARRGNAILGLAGEGLDGLPYSTLSYANGPGYTRPDARGRRLDIRKADMRDNGFKFPSMVPLVSETHGGDDVAVFAKGPWSHLFAGSFEQNFIPHAMGFAACLGKGLTACHYTGQEPIK